MASIERMHRKLAGGVAIAVVAALAVTVAFSLARNDRQGGSAPPLTSPQSATAESGGVTLTVSRAEFSGTATFVDLAASVAGADATRATRVTIPAAAFVAGNMAPADLAGNIMLIANGPAAVQRLRPVAATGPAKIVLSYVDVDDGQGGRRRVTGNWVLDLKPPADLANALRLEKLSPGQPATAQGVTVRPLSATRSSTETLVTVALDGPPGIEQLALPELAGASSNGGPVYGARIAGGPGEPVTFAFPPTTFGKPLQIEFTEFVSTPPAGSGGARWVDLRLGDLLQRQGVTGKSGEQAAVDASDVAGSSSGEPVTVTGIEFYDGIIRFNLAGYFPTDDGVTLTLADGTKLLPALIGSQTGTSPTGDIGQGAGSFVTFQFGKADLRGTVRLTLAEPGSILRDSWRVDFTP